MSITVVGDYGEERRRWLGFTKTHFHS